MNITIRAWLAGAAACAISACLCGAAAAQGAGQQDGANAQGETLLDEITVTGSRSAQRISETARTLYALDGAKIERAARSGLSLQQILAQEIPSFDAASQGARTSYGQNLRGRPALILIDGVSLNSARGLARQFDSIDPFNIARVEVLSGATALYGGNATGGVINIITKKGRDAEPGVHGEVTVGAQSGFRKGDDLDRNAAGAVTYKDERFDARLSASGSRSGGFYDGSGRPLVPDITQTSTAFNDRIDLMGSFGVQIDPNRRFEVTGQYFDSKQDSKYGLYYGPNFAALRDPSLFETRKGYSSDFDPKTARKMVNASYTDADVFGQELLLQGFYRTEEINFHPFPYGSYFGGSQQETDYYGFKAALVAKPIDGLKITYGVDGDRDAFSSRQHVFDIAKAAASGGLDFDTVGVTGLYPKIAVSTIAGFADVSYEATDRLTLNGGARYQYAKTKVSDFVGAAQQVGILLGAGTSADAIPGGSVGYDAFLLNAGATYRLTDVQQVYANFSQGFELPDPAKYYGVGVYSLANGRYSLVNSVNVADSALQAIKTNSFEIGYRFDDGTYSAEAAAYYSLSDKSIALNRQTLAIDVENNKRRAYGVEGRLGAKLGHGFDIGALGHLVRTDIRDDGGWEKASVGEASLSKLGGHVGWTGGALSLRLDAQHVFDLSDADGFKIDGFTLFNLTGAYAFGDGLTANFGVQNLFDKTYTTVWGARAKALYGALASETIFDYRGRGRTFAASLTKTF